MKKLSITLKRGYPGVPEKHRRILQALGLKKRHQVVVKEDIPSIRGMVSKVIHLVDLKEIEE
jgi:large subunit ribosomal protein L30